MTPNPKIKVAKRYLFRFAALVIGLAVGLLVAEIALRIVGYSSPQFYRADETLGYKLIPGLRGWYTKEGRNFVTINSDGFHDAEHTLEKPADTLRIAFVGDSYVEAFQVGREASFAKFVANELRDCKAVLAKRVEVLSFGISGYGTAQELLLLREKVLPYSPDLVVLVMTTNNDITDNLREFKQTPIPYFVFEGDKLVLDASFRGDTGFKARNSSLSRLGTWFENNLRFVQGIREIARKAKDWYRRPSQTPSPDQPAAPTFEVGIDSEVYREPAGEKWNSGWRVTEAIIASMKTEAESHGARFVVVTASNGVQVLPGVEERVAFAKLLGVDDLFYPDRRIADLCRSNSIPVVTLAPFLADYAARENVSLHGFEGNIGYGHWNQLAHRVAGEEIGRQLCTGVLR